jgi:hypothetical protein
MKTALLKGGVTKSGMVESIADGSLRALNVNRVETT